MFRKARWGVVTGIVLSAVSLLCAQEIEGLAPREDTVFVKGGNIVLFGGDIYFVDRDTFFVLRPETHFETIYSSRTESLYDTLETRLKRHRWTGELYNMLFRRQRPVGHNVEEDIERTRNAFLPFEGKNIGKIYYHQVDIYEGSVDDTTLLAHSWLGKTLNSLHADTRQGVIRRMLRFKEGDRLDPDILADSERLIRDLSYIEDVRLHVRPDETSQERVNVLIITKDRFSIGVDGSSSGLDRFRMGVYDNNFIGTGIEMGHQLLYEGRYGQPLGYRGSLRLNNLGRSLMTTDVYYTYSEKINEFRVRLDRGFFTPEIKYGGGIDLSRSNRYRQQLASDGIEIELPYTANYYDVWAGRSFLLPGKQVRSNLSFSLRYLGVAFEDRPPVTENDNFFFHKRNFILGTFTFIQRRFFRSRNFSGFGDTEDIPTGFSLALTGGYDNGEFRRRPYASLDLNSGMWLGNAGYLGLHITTAGFLSDRRWEDGLLDFQVLYFSNLLPMKNFRTRQIFQFRYAQGIRRNNPGEFLDFKKQLRNFPNENPRGQSMMTIHFESVLFTPWNFYGFKTAFFAFTDLGYLYNKKGELFPGTGLYSSIGLGIRLRNPSLVFQTLEFRLAYIPRLETGQQHWYPDFLSDSPDLFLNLHHAKPVVPAYGH